MVTSKLVQFLTHGRAMLVIVLKINLQLQGCQLYERIDTLLFFFKYTWKGKKKSLRRPAGIVSEKEESYICELGDIQNFTQSAPTSRFSM